LTDDEEDGRTDNRRVSHDVLDELETRPSHLEIGRQQRLQRAGKPPEIGDLDEEDLAREQRRSCDEGGDIAEGEGERRCRRERLVADRRGQPQPARRKESRCQQPVGRHHPSGRREAAVTPARDAQHAGRHDRDDERRDIGRREDPHALYGTAPQVSSVAASPGGEPLEGSV